MDIILGSMPPIATAQPYRCAADGTQLRPVQKIRAFKDLGKMKLYWAKRVKLSMGVAYYSVTKSRISAERSTIPWPPNLDDKSIC